MDDQFEQEPVEDEEEADMGDPGQAKDDFQEILRGGQEIEDGGKENEVDYIVDQELDQNEDDEDQEVNQEIQIINDGEQADQFDEQIVNGEEDDEEEELIDIDNLADNEKVVLWHYLSEEYQKNPDQLPMPRDIVEQFLADNQELVQRLSNMQ